MPLPVLPKVVPFQKAGEVLVAFENLAPEFTPVFKGIKLFETVPLTLKPASDVFEIHGPCTKGVIGFPEVIASDRELREIRKHTVSSDSH